MTTSSLAHQIPVLKPNLFYQEKDTCDKTNNYGFPPSWPDIDSIVTEDDEPVDNIFSEKQQRLLTDSLYNSYEGNSFVAMANVGLFYAPNKPPLVPDVLVSLNVEIPADVWVKHNRSYFVPKYGKPPEVVIEIVSNLKGNEAGKKLPGYANAKVLYYAIFDPENQLKQGVLRLYKLTGSSYVRKDDLWLTELELGLTLWKGRYENRYETWLRWCDCDGKPILVGQEATEVERKAKQKERKAKQKAIVQLEQEHQRAEREHQRAEQEHQRAEYLAAKLRALGIEPD